MLANAGTAPFEIFPRPRMERNDTCLRAFENGATLLARLFELLRHLSLALADGHLSGPLCIERAIEGMSDEGV